MGNENIQLDEVIKLYYIKHLKSNMFVCGKIIDDSDIQFSLTFDMKRACKSEKMEIIESIANSQVFDRSHYEIVTE